MESGESSFQLPASPPPVHLALVGKAVYCYASGLLPPEHLGQPTESLRPVTKGMLDRCFQINLCWCLDFALHPTSPAVPLRNLRCSSCAFLACFYHRSRPPFSSRLDCKRSSISKALMTNRLGAGTANLVAPTPVIAARPSSTFLEHYLSHSACSNQESVPPACHSPPSAMTWPRPYKHPHDPNMIQSSPTEAKSEILHHHHHRQSVGRRKGITPSIKPVACHKSPAC